jgi:DNA-binding MarR family transcriptional regulator
MGELGERVVLSRSRVSRVVDDLAAAGLVRREPNPADARSSYALLTPTGRERFRAAAPIYLRAIEREVAGELSAEQLTRLADLLRRMAGGGQEMHSE